MWRWWIVLKGRWMVNRSVDHVGCRRKRRGSNMIADWLTEGDCCVVVTGHAEDIRCDGQAPGIIRPPNGYTEGKGGKDPVAGGAE